MKGYFMTKNSFVVEVTFKDLENPPKCNYVMMELPINNVRNYSSYKQYVI